MRKFLKNNILEIFETIYQAHNSVKKYVSKKDFQNAVSILEDCQNTAIQIGTIIENSEGEGFVTVRFLEEYCEAVYEVSSNLSDETNENKIQKTLDKKLMNAESSVKNDIKVRLEIVFCPYKASMWDSLESVWKAANDDPDCDAYVVPIPYYDRKPDGSLGEFHYEGGEYPDYVPIVHYEAYNFEKRRPDAVYIHNPYDEYNSVTSVDPRFYSHELKKYTDCLVYIPYFVVSNIVPEHFCTLSACINADYVIVQSEQIRNTYVSNYTSVLGDSRINAEEKMLALGSPKFDAVFVADNTDFELPCDWKKIAGDKKIVLYNTSVGAILNGNEEYLSKIISVLNYFSAHREVVLWWRPHPLSSAVYNSMRNYLLDKYIKVVNWYKNAGFGIFDDSSDLHRAISCSDAYYGDRSSLVALYQLTGKPVLLQNIGVTDFTSEQIKICFEDIYDDGEYLWFSAMNFNGLFRMNKTSMTPEYMGEFPGEKSDNRLFCGICEFEGKLYFAPMSASAIAVYDMSDGSFERIEIKKDYTILSNAKLYSVVNCGRKLFFIPYAYDAIVCYDSESKNITYHTDWKKYIKRCIPELQNVYYFRKCSVYNDMLYLPVCCGSGIVVMDTKTGETNYISDTDNSSYHGIIVSDDKLYLAPNTGKPTIYDISFGKMKKISVFNSEKSVPTEYVDICDCDDSVMLFPYLSDNIIKINKEDESIGLINDDILTAKPTPIMSEYSGRFIFAKRIGNYIYSYSLEYGCMFVYDICSSEWKKYEISVSDEDIPKIKPNKMNLFNRVNSDTTTADENNFCEGFLNIADLADFLCSSSDNMAEIKSQRSEVRKRTLSNPDGTAGEKIHDTIKKMVLIK